MEANREIWEAVGKNVERANAEAQIIYILAERKVSEALDILSTDMAYILYKSMLPDDAYKVIDLFCNHLKDVLEQIYEEDLKQQKTK